MPGHDGSFLFAQRMFRRNIRYRNCRAMKENTVYAFSTTH